MTIIKSIVNSAKKAWNGEEKLWKVFWLWGVGVYVGSPIIIILSEWLLEDLSLSSFRILPFLKLEDFVWLIFAAMLLYSNPYIVCSFINRNIKNIDVKNRFLRKVSVFFLLMFLPIWFSIVHFLFFGFFLLIALSGPKIAPIIILIFLLIFLTACINYRFYKNYKQKSLIFTNSN